MRVFWRNYGLEIWSPAKLNLFFEILGRRPDGYHEVRTLMMPINLYDTIRLRRTSTDQMVLTCRVADRWRPFDPTPDNSPRAIIELPPHGENLIVRALALVHQSPGTNSDDSYDSHHDHGHVGWEAALVKRIPAAAGLGGASGNAAAALRAVQELLAPRLPDSRTADERERPSPKQLTTPWYDWAAQLGSDVPFFLLGMSGMCYGRGEIITPLPLPRLYFVLVKPPAGLATADVYRHAEVPQDPICGADLVEALRKGRLAVAGKLMFNRLQRPATQLAPWLLRIQQVFERTDVLGHQMSGSGTSYFGLCRHRKHAVRLAAQLSSQRVGSVFVVNSLNIPHAQLVQAA